MSLITIEQGSSTWVDDMNTNFSRLPGIIDYDLSGKALVTHDHAGTIMKETVTVQANMIQPSIEALDINITLSGTSGISMIDTGDGNRKRIYLDNGSIQVEQV